MHADPQENNYFPISLLFCTGLNNKMNLTSRRLQKNPLHTSPCSEVHSCLHEKRLVELYSFLHQVGPSSTEAGMSHMLLIYLKSSSSKNEFHDIISFNVSMHTKHYFFYLQSFQISKYIKIRKYVQEPGSVLLCIIAFNKVTTMILIKINIYLMYPFSLYVVVTNLD